ncbi:MAG TPA: MraY family glycosyltransferase [Myxococcaceae bacterium]|jgi:UDP-GlcNAc:undecaprenyl-phosphate GlcNAc-1-phosphate transferase
MITFFVAFLTSLIVGAVLTLVVRNRAHAYGWFDQARSSRKIHARPIPRLGGLAIVGGFFAPLCALMLVDSGVGTAFFMQDKLALGLFAGGIAIALLGLYDDFRGAGARLKFTVQFGVAAALYGLGFRVQTIANPFGDPVALGWLAAPFTVLWIVGVVNAMNLIDGLDGLAGGVAFFAVLPNFILAFARFDVVLCLMMASLGGAVLGFLIFNFNPASIFMGDTGSMFLGFVLAAVSLKTCSKSGTAVSMLVPIIALGLPIMDTLLAVVRRTILRRPLFSADKEHIHHRVMSRMLLSHRHAVLALYGLCCLFALTALGLSYANGAQTAMLLTAIAVVVMILMRKLGYLNLSRAGEVGETRRRNRQLRSVVRDVTEAVGRAGTLPAIWDALRGLPETLDAARLVLRVDRPLQGGTEAVTFESSRAAGSALPFEMTLELREHEAVLGRLTLTWCDGRGEVDRDEELALEVLADAVAKAVAILQARDAADPAKVVTLR